MKYINTILIIILLVMSGCVQRQKSNDDFITVDITKSPDSKKNLILQDFMDVEYIPLETNDDFVNQGFVQAIGKEYILVTNRINDGTIFIYDRTGKALRKMNCKGQGNEECSFICNITLDENRREMFVNDIFAQRILVYDLNANFKRTIKYNEGSDTIFYTDIFNYDDNNLICYDRYNTDMSFFIISKQDGSMIKEIKIPFKEKRFLRQTNNKNSVTPGPYRPLIPHKGNWRLLELSSDTVYTLLPDYSLRPFLVRTPHIHSMEPEEFLLLRLLSDRYYFMETIKNVYDFDTKSGFPRTFFMYDKQEKSFFRYSVFNGDYSTQKEIYMNALWPVGHEIESCQSLNAHELVESYKKGELKGQLKEIAATLNEESNPVLMLIKHKK